MPAEDLREEKIVIGDHIYHLMPNADKEIFKLFEHQHGYQSISNRAQSAYQRDSVATPLKHEHIHVLRNHIPQELCQSLITEFENDQQGIQHPSVLEVILPQVLTEEVDEHLRSYFDSEYCVFWWSINKVHIDDEEEWYSTKWHCDGGPVKHLKLITYLNGYEEHGSDTGYLDEKSTLALKDIGYIFNQMHERNIDIEPLCQHFDINYQPKGVKANVGDTVIFNPYQLAHRAIPPKVGVPRYALNFCIVPSELHWKKVAEEYFFPIYDCQDFRDFTQISNKITEKTMQPNAHIEIGLAHSIENFEHVEYLLANIIEKLSTAVAIANHIKKVDPNLVECHSVFALLKLVKKIIIEQLSPEKLMEAKWLDALSDLAEYETNFIDSMGRYALGNKPNPNAVFWPNPEHEKHPQSKYDMLPYAKKQPIMDMNTAIGSAGSCFAFEIAKYFQQEGYNYVITERNDNPYSGMQVDGYTPGDTIAKFCANYGILFNTPSFCQLAEKAFGLRTFNKLLIKSDTGCLLDPYRENVAFNSQQAYLADYEQHVEAVKQAFLQCQVFVVTLGLNECWQLADGTVMSRNPRENMYHLVKHKTLSVEENVANIQRFFDIIKQHNPDFKLIISVSPIPFLATGRADEQHIISANCHSKAVLRVAADQLVSNNKDIYYLPSYELVTECVEDAWETDTRHVKSTTVAQVVAMFKEIFVTE
ncbi:MAG: GSCFA domain-containing protein [Colwellia sp.]|nr:GSCFA domain-containing protein [Colwellia sp.]MCW9081137.1 GSCFA domain-containing protein [Colwellia sp.]